LKRNNFLALLLPTLIFTVLGFAVMGYHPGAEDDGVYLAAVKADLHPTLFPHDSDFFRLQLQATKYDGWMAHFADTTRIPVAWSMLLWQLISVFLTLWACRRIAAQFFPEKQAQWASVALVSAMLTLPVAGTALTIVDQYLHPRSLATALILLAVAKILEGRRWPAVALLILSLVLHPIMGALGVSFCIFLVLALMERTRIRLRTVGNMAAALMPMGWIFEPPSPTWREALDTRSYYFLSRWAWYEWLGALAPLLLFWILWRVAMRRGEVRLAQFSLAVFAYGVFQQIVALGVLGPQAFVRLMPFQPMRYLHLVYVFLCLIGGALLGRYLLKARVWRWAVFLATVNGGMFLSQRQLFPASQHLELPFVHSTNPWIQAFEWIRKNTPEDAYFALDPGYMAAPGEDYHGFRALAERSVLSDAIKDAAVVTQVPELGPIWHRQQLALAGWSRFQLADFERLKAQFGVNWALVSYPPPASFPARGTMALYRSVRYRSG
jgi:hypothetical protein